MDDKQSFYPVQNCSGLDVPIFPRVMNLGFDGFETLSTKIVSLPREQAEWLKIPLLTSNIHYMKFLSLVTGKTTNDIAHVLAQFGEDSRFQAEFAPKLSELDGFNNVGDLRFHSVSLYAMVRLLKPRLVVETGVAHGKSTSLILLAMEHNKIGELLSFDIPAKGLNIDGSATSLHGKEIGWMVPPYLKDRWKLYIGNSLEKMPQALKDSTSLGKNVDLFLHDSLHTFQHTYAEFELVKEFLNTDFLICCDNIDLGSGYAFNKFLNDEGYFAVAFRDFAATTYASTSSNYNV